jgi:predicted cupin superfamily sugar epimerase
MPIGLQIHGNLTETQILWRYMDLAKFLSMLEQKALWLARTDTFKDRHEGRFPEEMRKLIEKAYKGFSNSDPSSVKDADDFQDYLVKNTFVSCWHKNSDENMVMWEIYGRDKNAVAIQTSVEKIKESIDVSNINGHSLILKSIIYKKSNEITGVLPYEDCFFIKRPHFSFEKEVRISLDTYTPSNPSKGTPYGYKLPVRINDLVDKILVHPDCSNWFLALVRSIVDKYNIHAPVSRGTYGTS